LVLVPEIEALRGTIHRVQERNHQRRELAQLAQAQEDAQARHQPERRYDLAQEHRKDFEAEASADRFIGVTARMLRGFKNETGLIA
jgi:hypothetical protein